VAETHDNRYFGFLTQNVGESAENKFGFLLDLRPDGFGYTTLDFHAQAAYSDPFLDELFGVNDGTNTFPVINENEIFQFDAAATLRPYRWRSKEFLLPHPNAFEQALVKAEDYDDLVLKFYADGNLIYTKRVTRPNEFMLPPKPARRISFEIEGTSRVQQVEFANDPMEFV